MRIVIKRFFKISAMDEFLCVRNCNCLSNLLIRGFWIAVKDVLFNRVVEQGWFLHHEPESSTQFPNIIFSNVYPVDQHLTEIRIIEAHNQTDQGGFTLARFANYCNRIIRMNLQIKTFENPLSFSCWVTEPNISELDLSFDVAHLLQAHVLLIRD